MSGTSVLHQKRVSKVSIYLMTFLAMAGLLAPIADASHCTALKDKADDAKEDWAAATSIYLTTATITAATCAQAPRTKKPVVLIQRSVPPEIASSNRFSWLPYMGVQAGRYYEAADKHAACQREHEELNKLIYLWIV